MRIVRETGNRYVVYQTVSHGGFYVEEPMAAIVNRDAEWRVAKLFYDVMFPDATPEYDEGFDPVCYPSLAAAVDSLR